MLTTTVQSDRTEELIQHYDHDQSGFVEGEELSVSTLALLRTEFLAVGRRGIVETCIVCHDPPNRYRVLIISV